MEHFLLRMWDELLGRVGGRFSFRFILQPLTAAIIAIVAGLKDAKRGSPAYGWSVLTDSANRSDLIRDGWKDIARLFLIAVVIDLVYEMIVFHWIRPGQSLLVAGLIAVPPYLLLRGPVNRIARWWKRRKNAPD